MLLYYNHKLIVLNSKSLCEQANAIPASNSWFLLPMQKRCTRGKHGESPGGESPCTRNPSLLPHVLVSIQSLSSHDISKAQTSSRQLTTTTTAGTRTTSSGNSTTVTNKIELFCRKEKVPEGIWMKWKSMRGVMFTEVGDLSEKLWVARNIPTSLLSPCQRREHQEEA